MHFVDGFMFENVDPAYGDTSTSTMAIPKMSPIPNLAKKRKRKKYNTSQKPPKNRTFEV